MSVFVVAAHSVKELGTKAEVRKVLTSVDSQRIKLSGFPQALRVRATEAQIDCPRRHDWDAFFRDAKDMDETKNGERPDTVVIDNLPVRWFAADVHRSTGSAFGSISKSSWPSAQILKDVFEIYGKIRRVDIPMLDPVQNPQLLENLGVPSDVIKSSVQAGVSAMDEDESNLKGDSTGFGKIAPAVIKPLGTPELDRASGRLTSETSAFNAAGSSLTFRAYVQYVDYSGFSSAMESLRGMKLVYAPKRPLQSTQPSEQSYFSAEIQVDFDRTKHLSDDQVERRDVARQRLDEWIHRRRAAAEVAEAKRQRLAREAEELAAKRKQEAEVLAEAQRRADEAERQASRLAREQRRRLKAEEKYRRKKDILMQQKFLLEGRRALIAGRRAAAIRVLSAVLHLISQREELGKSQKGRRKLVDSSCQTVDLSPIPEERHRIPESSTKRNSARQIIRAPAVSSDTKHVFSFAASPVVAPSQSPETTELDRLRQNLLERRESQLRQRLLERRMGTTSNLFAT
ncbi:anchor protein 17A [Sparganum proliferum]